MASPQGVPDWQSLNGYPHEDAPARVWAWEFLRRSPDYRSFWEEKCAPFLRAVPCFGYGAGTTTTALSDWPHLDELIDRFAVDVPSAPDEATPPLFSTVATRCVRGDFPDTPVAVTNVWQHQSGQTQLISREVDTMKGFKAITLDEAETAFVIDLARPLRDQLDNIERIAKRLQDERGGIKEGRERREMYALYLRILDAKDAGAKVADVKNVLLPDEALQAGRGPKIKWENIEERRNRKYYELRAAAVAMRDGGYKKLIGG